MQLIMIASSESESWVYFQVARHEMCNRNTESGLYVFIVLGCIITNQSHNGRRYWHTLSVNFQVYISFHVIEFQKTEFIPPNEKVVCILTILLLSIWDADLVELFVQFI